ncbi:hypothetical protein FSP39_024121 [Pinctada imbricata]|uniref:t-SNARE coiled-coil homology domain-containing protein n=1 Tax=Pinctada imbricata TaxID=66713 RepID=A0AA89BV59_PINIB|nr:hypothetical protein FSP39_024121 [Pinctada imbricata]
MIRDKKIQPKCPGFANTTMRLTDWWTKANPEHKGLVFSRLNDWNGLHKENINATRTVQQIKANIKEIENTRKRIVDEDVEEFDKKTSGMKYDAVLAIQEFLCSVQSEESTPESPSGSTPEGDDPLGSFSMHRSSSDHMNISLHQLQIESEHDNSETIESWENLHQNLVELNTMIHEFSSAVQSQQESIDRIEDNIEKAHENVRSGVTNLSKASKYKAAAFPVAGALIGTVIGGPVGFLAGLKIGSVAAIGGGAAGFLGGRFYKKRQDKVVEAEMKNLSAKRSNSMSDIPEKVNVGLSSSSWLPWKS